MRFAVDYQNIVGIDNLNVPNLLLSLCFQCLKDEFVPLFYTAIFQSLNLCLISFATFLYSFSSFFSV